LTQRLNSFLTSSQELRQISGKVKQLRVLQQHYAKIAPPSLLNFSQVLHIEQNILTLAANNGAVAAKLRQMAPELIRQLQLQGCEVTGIQVKVQVTVPVSPRVALPATLSAEGRQQLSELTDALSESPLKNALMRLLQHKPKNK
jgi:hypothetical protein